jgi:hypothetical protein
MQGDGGVAGLRDAVGGVSRRGVGGGAWRAEKKPGHSGFGSTCGRAGGLVGGATRGRPGGRAGVRTPPVGRAQGGERLKNLSVAVL